MIVAQRMPEKVVWYPGRSRAVVSPEPERGRGSSNVQQPASKSSAAATPKKKVVSAVKETPLACSNYSTVERGEETSILDYSVLSIYSRGSVFSGWQDEELRAQSSSGVGGAAIVEVAAGLRSGMTSRLDSRTGTASQRRRGEDSSYQFTHLLEAHEHMEHYRTHYCYTTLICAPPQNSSPVGPDLVDQGQQALFKLEVKSLYRGDPFLRELASRLGVVDSIREPQLLTPHRKTAPSIVKKPRNKTDIVIDLTPKQRSDEDEDDLCSPGAAWTVDNTKQQPPHSARPFELPRISEVTHKAADSSTISLNKYLRVSSHGEEGTSLPHVPTSTQLSSTSDTTTTTEQFTECTPSDPQPVETTPTQEQATPTLNKAHGSPLAENNKPSVHTLNKAQKEKLISATAQLLGLSSREWAAPPTSRQLNRYLDYSSRPVTQQRERMNKKGAGNKQEPPTRPATRQETKKVAESRSPSRQLQRTVQTSRSTTRQKQSSQGKRPESTLARHKEKLDRLKSIYSQPSSTSSRPHTRLHIRAKDAEPQSSSTSSRPHTRLHTRAKDVEQDTLDGSCYWNDIRVPTSHEKEARKNKTEGDGLSEVISQHSKSLSGKVLKNRTKPIKPRINEELTPGSSPIAIARHIARFKHKFDGVLNVHKHQILS